MAESCDTRSRHLSDYLLRSGEVGILGLCKIALGGLGQSRFSRYSNISLFAS